LRVRAKSASTARALDASGSSSTDGVRRRDEALGR
jgi:hypothetical protein